MGDDFTRCRMTWLDQIYDDPNVTAAVRDIAFRLSRYFNRKRFVEVGILNAWPSYETLAEEAGCTVKTIYRAIKSLRERKHIETTEGRGRSRTLQYLAKIKPRVVSNTVERHEIEPEITRQESPVIENKPDISVLKTGHLETIKLDTNVLQTSMKKSLNKSLNEAHPENPAFEPFKAAWSLVVFDRLSKEPCSLPRPRTATLRKLIEVDKVPSQIRDHQAKHGWPEVNRMFERPVMLDQSELAPAAGKMALDMEPVTAGSDLWMDWRSEFEARGWPFPHEAKVMAFPRGGAKRLDMFLNALAARQAGGASVLPMSAKAVSYG